MNEQKRLDAMTAPLMAWYDVNKRTLPWRGITDPYRIWVSEIMLQQTRVQAVLGYYERFMAELPTVYDLAKVSEEKLLKLWEGLGYYSRARNLKRAAETVVRDYGGEFPHTSQELRKLAGIGDYTASAIASIAFGAPESAVDGNLLRVAARVTGIADDIMDAKVRARFRAMLDAALDTERAGEWNQAMMDLGATVCLPNGAPLCGRCPARSVCAAYQNELTEVLPVRAAKKARRVEERTVFLLRCGDKIALHKRESRGLLAKLWEFPNVLGNLDAAGAEIALASLGVSATDIAPLGHTKHIFTHIEWDMHGYFCEAMQEGGAFTWVDAAAFDALAIPSAFRYFTPTARDALHNK